VVGVQWHPEDTASADAAQQGLFDAFVAATRQPVASDR
jgi:putative glutamine amidotransferase